MKNILPEFCVEQEKFNLFCVKQSAIHLWENSISHSRLKHIKVWCHWIKETLEMKLFSLKKIDTNENDSNMMIKSLYMTKIVNHRKKTSMVEQPLSTWVVRGVLFRCAHFSTETYHLFKRKNKNKKINKIKKS